MMEDIPLSKPPRSLNKVSLKDLLDRPPEEDYLAEWTGLLALQKEDMREQIESSVLIFRLGREWLALSTLVCAEVAEERTIHRIPHRSGRILLGVVNLRGQMILCMNLQNLLGIEPLQGSPALAVKGLVYQRFLAIQKEDESWIVPVDEVHGVYHYPVNKLENVPVTMAKSKENCLKGFFNWHNQRVGLLDDELLFSSLKRSFM